MKGRGGGGQGVHVVINTYSAVTFVWILILPPADTGVMKNGVIKEAGAGQWKHVEEVCFTADRAAEQSCDTTPGPLKSL